MSSLSYILCAAEFKHAMMQGKENNVKAILAAMNSNSGEPEVQIQGLSALISFASKFSMYMYMSRDTQSLDQPSWLKRAVTRHVLGSWPTT